MIKFKITLMVESRPIMSETPHTIKTSIHWKNIPKFLFHPRQEFENHVDQKKGTWLAPLLLLSITYLLIVLVGGYFRARAAAMGEISLPSDWQWWSSDMQENYMQAVQATQGPVFLYIIPAVTGLAGLWLGWGILSGLLHLGSTLLGGRGTITSALNITAWSSLPFAVRDLLRILFIIIAKHPVSNAGLSGFVTGTEGGALYLANLLKNLDIFLIWQVLLLILGFRIIDLLPRGKALAGVVIVVFIVLAAKAGLGALGSGLGGMFISQPIF
jgi:hypothetical protein